MESNEVDEFLEKLVQSSKFDMLVEKIANRAVEKIMSKKSQKDQIHSSLRNVDGKENVKVTKTDQTSHSNKGKPGNIDLQAAISKFSENPYDQLSLKYKHLLNNEVHEATKPIIEKTQSKNVEKSNIQGRHKVQKRPLAEFSQSFSELSLSKVIENDKKAITVDVSYENAKMGYENLEKLRYDTNTKEPSDNTANEGINANNGVKNGNSPIEKIKYSEKLNRDRPAADKLGPNVNQNIEFVDKNFGMGSGALVSDIEQKFKTFDGTKVHDRQRRPSMPEYNMQKQFRATENDPNSNVNGAVVSEDSSSVTEEHKGAVVEVFDTKGRTERTNLIGRRENTQFDDGFGEYYYKIRSGAVRNKRVK